MLELRTPALATWFRKKFGTPTAAQERTVPRIIAGKSVLLSSPTGSGKTLAAFLGVIDFLAQEHEAGTLGEGIQAVYVSPLRALAYDLQKNLRGPLEELGFDFIRVGIRTGDTSAKDRDAIKRRPPHILVTTPESLLLMLTQASYREAFGRVRFLIVDELHALAENKRGAHLMLSAERLEAMVIHGAGLVRIGLSATVRPLETMAHYLCGVGRSCEIVEVSEKKTSIIEVFSPIRKNPYPPAGYTAGRVLEELADVLRQKRTTLIFCNTRGGAESIGHRLKLALPELAEQIEVHHASLDREIRLQVEDRLKAGNLRAVVCSTSLEMGIDIGSIDLVVMVSAPKGVARALQRLGRSGHSRHDMSHGLLVATNVNDLVECAVTAKLMETKELEPVRVPETPVDVLAQHLVSWAVPCDLTTDQAYARATRAWNFRHLTRTQFDRVLQYLQGGGASLEKQYADRFGKIALENGRLVIPRPRITREFYQNVGTISSDTMISVKLGRKRLGTVEERFLKGLQLGDVFVLNGQCVRLVETRMLEAKVTHARGELPTVPRWNANKMPLQSGLAREVVRLRSHLSRFLTVRNPQFENPGQPVGTAIPNAIAWLVEEYALTASNAEAIVRQYAAQARVSLIPTEDTFLIEIFREENRRHIFFHSLIGRSANDALSRIITWRVKQQCGGNALVTIDDYGFLLTLRQEQQLDLEAWKELFRPAGAAEDLHAILQDSELVRWQFSGVAQTGLMVPRQLNGAERQPKALQWTADIIYEVLQKYEPDHPLLEEAYREATHKFLDFPRALEFLERSQALDWKQVEVPKVSPLAFGIFVSKIKETMMLEDPEEAIERLYQQMYQDVVGDGK